MPRWWKRLVFGLADAAMRSLFGSAVNEVRRELQRAPIRRWLMDWSYSPQRILGFFPAWFAPPQPDWPPQLRLTGFPLYDELQGEPLPAAAREFLAQGEKPLVFFPGSVMCARHDFFAASLDACRRLGRRGVFLTRFREQLPPLPQEVRHFDFVPFSQLLPHAAALVHHGGMGTSAQAMAAGIPQLVMPLAYDQPDNALRLRRLGVAAELPPRHYRGPAVAAALDRLLTAPEVAACCQQIAARFKPANAVTDACRWIEELGDLGSPATRI